jgi:hypothetical protein
MSDFKERVIVERKELEDKISKLSEFLASDKITTIPQVQFQLLKVQLKAMETYLECLIIRTRYW